jgi:RNA-splicing ligase RtcB
VIATKGAIIPSAVGVDIGCGMAALKLPLKVDQINNLIQRSNLQPTLWQSHFKETKTSNLFILKLLKDFSYI